MPNSDGLHVVYGAGPLGAGVAERLLAVGKRVRLVTRSGTNPLHAGCGLELRAADASDPSAAMASAEGASVVLHAMNAPYPQWAKVLPALLTNLITAAERAGARLVVADNLYMHDHRAGPVTDRSPVAPPTRKGRLRAALATQALRAHADGRCEIALVRGSDFYGPRVVGAHMGRENLEAVLAGRPVRLLGDVDRLHSLTYAPDFVTALVALAQADSAYTGRAWIAPTGPPTSFRHVVNEAAKLAGAPPPRLNTPPGWAVRGLGLVSPMMREMGEMLPSFEDDYVVESSDFELAFGTRATPLRTGLTETLDWLRSMRGAAHPALLRGT